GRRTPRVAALRRAAAPPGGRGPDLHRSVRDPRPPACDARCGRRPVGRRSRAAPPCCGSSASARRRCTRLGERSPASRRPTAPAGGSPPRWRRRPRRAGPRPGTRSHGRTPSQLFYSAGDMAAIPGDQRADEGGDGRKEEIARAALAVVARSGARGATLRDIAREAGYTTGVIGYYFDGRDDLIAHVHRYAHDRIGGTAGEP